MTKSYDNSKKLHFDNSLGPTRRIIVDNLVLSHFYVSRFLLLCRTLEKKNNVQIPRKVGYRYTQTDWQLDRGIHRQTWIHKTSFAEGKKNSFEDTFHRPNFRTVTFKSMIYFLWWIRLVHIMYFCNTNLVYIKN